MADPLVSMEVDNSAGREIDVLGLGCSKESFTEHSEIVKLIDEVVINDKDSQIAKKNWQRFTFILDQYQEQPHLIDPFLEHVLNRIVDIIKNENLGFNIKHEAFRHLYFISKVRGYKVIARLLPHEVIHNLKNFVT